MRRAGTIIAVGVILAGGLVATGSASANSGTCRLSSAVSALAKERRLSSGERSALTSLVAQLRAHPVGGSCVSATFPLRGGSPAPGKPDRLCLQALGVASLVSRLHWLGVSSATRRVAAHVFAVVMADEKRGTTLCVVPPASG